MRFCSNLQLIRTAKSVRSQGPSRLIPGIIIAAINLWQRNIQFTGQFRDIINLKALGWIPEKEQD